MNATTYTQHTIPAGHYAVVWPGNGKTYFFRVTIGKSGKWQGFRFITRQSSDDYLRMTAEGRKAWWPLLLADVTGAAQRYGQEIGRCGFCHKTLTDETSRAYGVGPDCRKQHGIA
jgi:hypothetical protein